MSTTMIFWLVVATVALFMVYKIGQSSVSAPAPVVLGIDKAIGIHKDLMIPIKNIVKTNGDGVDEKTKEFVLKVGSAIAALSIRSTADSFGIDDRVSVEGKQRVDNHNIVIAAALKTHETMRNEKETIIEKLQTEIREHAGRTNRTVENQTTDIATTNAAMAFFQVQ